MFCPRGIFNDVILSKITRNVKPPALLRSTAFKVAFLVFLIVNLVWGLYNAKNFAQAGFVFVRLVSLTTAIAIVLGFYYQQRTWCGFCPMGFLATLTIKLRKLWSLKEPAPARKPESVQFKNNIILYTGSHCPPCEEIKEILTQKKIKFVEKNIDTDQFSRDELYSIYEITYVPTLVIDGKAYNSKSKEELDKLLGRK